MSSRRLRIGDLFWVVSAKWGAVLFCFEAFLHYVG
jgi:hypothetical protein